jgi:hypothetical protein
MFFGDDDFALRAVADSAEAAAVAPSSGQKAVQRAEALDELREGEVGRSGSERSRALGSHTYYLVDETWTRDGFDPDVDAPEVEVGSAEFLELIQRDPSIAEAAALGERVTTMGPDGWITIVWPDVDDGE